MNLMKHSIMFSNTRIKFKKYRLIGSLITYFKFLQDTINTLHSKYKTILTVTINIVDNIATANTVESIRSLKYFLKIGVQLTWEEFSQIVYFSNTPLFTTVSI